MPIECIECEKHVLILKERNKTKTGKKYNFLLISLFIHKKINTKLKNIIQFIFLGKNINHFLNILNIALLIN